MLSLHGKCWPSTAGMKPKVNTRRSWEHLEGLLNLVPLFHILIHEQLSDKGF